MKIVNTYVTSEQAREAGYKAIDSTFLRVTQQNLSNQRTTPVRRKWA
jgi:hypothetical protein